MNYNKLINKIFFTTRLRRGVYKKFIDKIDNYPCLVKYLLSISNNIKESLYRIHYNDFEKHICKICGKEIDYFSSLNFCSQECRRKSQIINTKISNKERYGVENVAQVNEYIQKSLDTKKRNNIPMGAKNPKYKQTCLEKYGVENVAQHKECILKSYQTKLERYGYINSFQNKDILDKAIKKLSLDETNEKRKKTLIEKYGVDNIFKDKSKFNYKAQIEHGIETKFKNHTFNTSIPESESYKILLEQYSDIIYQYRSNKYPFICDFYIPSLDLYIECNYHWTHGKRPYTGSEKDKLIVEQWKEKNTKYYDNAISTWTERDVRKRNIAKQNELNYIEFWNINELKEWIKKGDS